MEVFITFEYTKNYYKNSLLYEHKNTIFMKQVCSISPKRTKKSPVREMFHSKVVYHNARVNNFKNEESGSALSRSCRMNRGSHYHSSRTGDWLGKLLIKSIRFPLVDQFVLPKKAHALSSLALTKSFILNMWFLLHM